MKDLRPSSIHPFIRAVILLKKMKPVDPVLAGGRCSCPGAWWSCWPPPPTSHVPAVRGAAVRGRKWRHREGMVPRCLVWSHRPERRPGVTDVTWWASVGYLVFILCLGCNCFTCLYTGRTDPFSEGKGGFNFFCPSFFFGSLFFLLCS